MNIFTRQKALIGANGQQRLAQAHVCIVGLGALGSCAAHLLARMGIGKLTLIDDDSVADHNLGRQHLYTVADIGSKKVVVAKQHLSQINPSCIVVIKEEFVTEENVDIIGAPDIIIDCLDTHHARRIIDRYATKHNIPWIHGAAIERKGIVTCFLPSSGRTYDSLYSKDAKDQHCEITGVLATITTLVGTMQAQLAVDYLLTGTCPKQVFRYNLDSYESLALDLKEKSNE